jgi:AAA domain
MTDFAELIEPVARRLLGEPNRNLSNARELRWGTHGSFCVDLQKGVWSDHETGQGGGVLDLIERETGLKGADRIRWLEREGFIRPCEDRRPFKIVARYDYRDEGSALLFQVCRLDPKDFRQCRQDPHGKDIWSVQGIRQVPYKLPDLIEAISLKRVIFIVEGEKDVDRMWNEGAPATCNAGGCGKWGPSHTEWFEGADVVVVSDNDPQKRHPKTGELLFHPDDRPVLPGQDHAESVAFAVRAVAERVRYLDLKTIWPEIPEKGDISDWLDAGHTIDELYEIVERLPDWRSREAPKTNEAEPPDRGAPPLGEPSKPIALLSKANFIGGFVPPDYLVVGMLNRRFVYALTGQTGHAKTAIALLIAELVSRERRPTYLGAHEVERGHVVYFVGENPDDVRMRIIGSDFTRDDEDHALDKIDFIVGRFDIAGMMETLRKLLASKPVDLIIVDTSAAYFLGDDEISNPEMGKHARMMRALTTLPGGPCILVLCHPVKHVAAPDQLLPRGGGAFLAEMDGNLTIWKPNSEDIATLHHGKIRGPGFDPLSFKVEPITKADKLRDSKGRQMPTVRAVPISQAEEERVEFRAADDENLVMEHLLRLPEQNSQAGIAAALGWRMKSGEPHKVRVARILERLSKQKPALIRMERGPKGPQPVLTEKGKEAARKAAIARARERDKGDNVRNIFGNDEDIPF